MKFDKGHSKLGGKTKGTPNKATRDQREIITKIIDNNIDNIQSWIEEVAKQDKRRAFDMVKDLMEFSIPKLKAIDLTTNGKDMITQNIIVPDKETAETMEKLKRRLNESHDGL